MAAMRSLGIGHSAACAETDDRPQRGGDDEENPSRHHDGVRYLSFRVDHLGVLFVALEDLQASLQQALEFAVARGWNELRLERAVHRLVVGDLIVDMGLVEGGAIELRQFCTLALTGPRCDLAI
jgi:hypothetical protein